MNPSSRNRVSSNATADGGPRLTSALTKSSRGFEAIALLGLLIQQRWLLSVSGPTAQALGFVILLAGLAGAGWLRPVRVSVPAILAAWLAHRFAPEPVRVSHLLIDLALLAVLGARGARSTRAMACAATVLSALVAFEHGLPGAFEYLNEICRHASSLVGRLIDSPANLGVTYLGLVPLVTYAAYVAAMPWLRRRIAYASAALVFVVAAWPPAVCFLSGGMSDLWLRVSGYLPLVIPGLWHEHHTHNNPWLMGMAPLLICGVVIGLLFIWDGVKPKMNGPREPSGAAPWHYALAALCGLLVGLAPQAGWSGSIDKRKVVLYDAGLIDWRVPVPDKYYGVGSSGMFGQFERLLHRLSLDVTKVKDLSNLPDPGSAILVVINPDKISDEVAERVRQFVDDGGGLLAMGDHTDMEGIAGHLNRLMAFAGVRWRFDSAFTARLTWINGYRLSSHPLADLLGTSNERFQQSTGASLALSDWRWQPVAWGQYTFSDLGNRLKPKEGYLGDYAYQRGELLGDLAVVAVRDYGAGRVAVFGDTSAFQNLAIPRCSDMVQEVLRYVGSRATPWSWLAPFAVVAALSILVIAGRCRWEWLGTFALGCLIILTATYLVRASQRRTLYPAGETARVAAIDYTHHNAFTLEHFKVRSVDGLFNNLMRNDYWPAPVMPPNALHNVDAEIYFLIAPMSPLSRPEVDGLLERVSGGATLVLSVGYEEAAVSMPLLERLGISMGATPLGPVPLVPKLGDPTEYERLRESPQFTEAWPLNWAKDGPWQPYYQWKGFTVIAARMYGKGRVIVIGDSRYLLDETLETERDYWPGNIKYFRAMLMTWPTRDPSEIPGPVSEDKP